MVLVGHLLDQMPSDARHLPQYKRTQPCHCEPIIEGEARNVSRIDLVLSMITDRDRFLVDSCGRPESRRDDRIIEMINQLQPNPEGVK